MTENEPETTTPQVTGDQSRYFNYLFYRNSSCFRRAAYDEAFGCWAILTVIHCGESVVATDIDQLERRNIKEHEVTRPYDRIYSHKATKAAYSV